MIVYYDHNVKEKMIDFSRKIKQARKQKNLSQDKFAKLLGFSKGYIADIESGRTGPSRNFLEALQYKGGVLIEWLLLESKILDLIEWNKTTNDPYIIFVYAFTQEGIDTAGEMLVRLLSDRKYILVDASGVKSDYQFYKKILNQEGKLYQLSEKLENMMLNEEVVLIIKNLSLSKIPRSGGHIRSIFKIMDDAWDREGYKKGGSLRHLMPPSSLIVLDFPSYLEKNMNTFGFYAVPIYAKAMGWQGRSK